MAAQIPDNIYLDGDLMALYTNPLEQFWLVRKKRRLAFCPSEECKRGYIALWEIIGNELFLRDIEGSIRKSIALFGPKTAPCSLKKIFPRAKNNKVKADWYSGRLRIPYGNMTVFEDSDYNSRFERDIIITVERGNLIRTAILDNREHALTISMAAALT